MLAPPMLDDGRPVSAPISVVSARDSEDRQRRAARALLERGLVAGDRVALLPPGSADYVALALGALRVGIVPVPLDPNLTAGEREPLIVDASVALTVDSEAALDEMVAHDGRADLAPAPLARPMHYTSGTTGRPKGVWTGLLDESDAAALLSEERDMWRIDENDRHLVTSPLHHSAPLRFAMTTLLSGGDIVVGGRFSPSSWAAAVEATRPTTTFVVPAHLHRLREHGFPPMASVRLLAHAGAACPASLKREVLSIVGDRVLWEFYGSTEGQFTACSGAKWRERPGTVGTARPGRQIKVDEDSRIWCSVPRHARFSYWGDPVKTSDAWRGESFTVEDLGRIDDDGYLFLDGRREDLVITGGVNVYPAEVESVLSGCPGVAEVAVYGVPDPAWGQRVCAAVVGDVAENRLRDWAKGRLAPAKRPKDYRWVAELPRTASGKVLRRALVDEAAPSRAAPPLPHRPPHPRTSSSPE